MKVEVLDIYSREIVTANPDKLYIFGENLRQQFTTKPGGGQAIIRGLVNTYGFYTLDGIGKFWSDKDFPLNQKQIEKDIAEIRSRTRDYDSIVFPRFGLGTGRAGMTTECPRTFLYMSMRLLDEFGFNNIECLVPMKQF